MEGTFVREAMEEAARLDTVLSFHEEDKHFIRENGINHGRISDELGIYGSPALAEDSLVARDCMIALDTGATVDIQHISSCLLYTSGVASALRRRGRGCDGQCPGLPDHIRTVLPLPGRV